jgi:hypothetical protein
MKVHELKCEEPHLRDIADGRKRVEMRFDDRGYEVGDILELQSLADSEFRVRVEVLHVLYGGQYGAYGIAPRYVCMSIRLTEWGNE